MGRKGITTCLLRLFRTFCVACVCGLFAFGAHAACYQITLNANGGTAGSTTTLYTKGNTGGGLYTNSGCSTSYSGTTAKPTRSGYTFLGYFSTQKSAVSSNTSDSSAFMYITSSMGVSPNTTSISSSRTVYAAWAKNCSISNGTCSVANNNYTYNVVYSASCNSGYSLTSGSGTYNPVCTSTAKPIYTVTINNTTGYSFTSPVYIAKNSSSGTYVVHANLGNAQSDYTGGFQGVFGVGGSPATAESQEFTGLYTASSGGTLIVNPDRTVTNSGTFESYCSSKSCTLYTHWQCKDGYTLSADGNSCVVATTYTVTYNNNGGSGCSSQSGVSGTTLTCTPTRTGYNFSGWYTASSDGTKVTTITSTRIVYAHWTGKTYTVTLKNGSTTIDTVTATYGSAMPTKNTSSASLTMPTKTKAVFNGYYTATSGGTQYYTNNLTSARAWDKTSNTTLYAQFSDCTCAKGTGVASCTAKSVSSNKCTYDVTYITGYYGPATQTNSTAGSSSYTATATPCTNEPSNASYTGSASSNSCPWACNANYYKNDSACSACSGVSFTDTGTCSRSESITGGTKNYTGGSQSRTCYRTTSPAGSTSSSSCTGSASCGAYGSCSGGSLSTVTCSAGYYKNSSNTCDACEAGYYCPGGTWSVSSSIAGRNPCSNKPSNSSYTGSATSNSCPWQCSTGYSTTGKKAGATTGTESGKSCTAIDDYAITYNLNSGTNYSGAPTTYKYGVGATINGTPTRTGYTFSGWTGSNGTSAQKTVTIATTATGDKTYTAHWTPNTYKVELDFQGGSGGDAIRYIYEKYNTGWYLDEDATQAMQSSIGAGHYCITPPTKTGYTFNGFYTKANGQTVTDADQVIQSTGCRKSGLITTLFNSNSTIYAHWTPNIYQVTLEFQGGSGDSATKYVYEKYGINWYLDSKGEQTMSSGGTNSVTIPTRTEYTFNGYYTAASGGTQAIKSNGAKVSGFNSTLFTDDNGKFYAQWTQCTACSAGTGANCSLSVVNNVCTYTTSCRGGYYNISNGGKYNPSCSPVTQGYYSPDGDGNRYKCTDFRANTTTTGTNSSSSSDCVCTNGYYLNSSNVCAVTEKGYYSGISNTRSACTGATYQDETGKTSCKSCPTSSDTDIGSYSYYNKGGTDDHTVREGCYANFKSKTLDHGSINTYHCYIDADADTYGATATGKICWFNINNDGLKCAGGYYNTSNNTSQPSYATKSALLSGVCTAVGDGYYSGTDSLTRTQCPAGYRDGTGTTAQSNCTASCAAGTRVASANAACSTPAGGWYTGAHTVNYGQISPVNYCMAGFSSSGTSASNHDASTDCIQSLSGKAIAANTISARYIKVTTTGSTSNDYSHVVEIQAFAARDGTGTNLLLGKTGPSGSNLSAATDGSWAVGNYAAGTMVWDMGAVKEVGSIKFALYTDGRTYHNVNVYVSTDNSNWTTVFTAADLLTQKSSTAKPEMIVLSAAPTNCSAGTYKAAYTATLGTTYSCSGCGDGQYQNESGKTSCKACSSLGGGLYTKSDGSRNADTTCYISTTAGKYLATKTDTAQTTCPVKNYCPSAKLYYPNVNTATACPATDSTTARTTFPDSYLASENLQRTSFSQQSWTTGITSKDGCMAVYSFSNNRGNFTVESVEYNSTTGKYDTGGGPQYYTKVNPGYYLSVPYSSTYCNTSTNRMLYQSALSCPTGSYCPGYTSVPLCNSGLTYGDDIGITGCPSAYPNSDAGATAITSCYSNTKSRSWTGSQIACSAPTGCSNATCNSCSNAACDYVAFSDNAGTADGTIKSGCPTNNASCQQTVKSVTAKANYYATLGGGAYTPLEYIESTGTQWIDTGYVVNTKTEAQIGINMTMVTGDTILGYCVNDGGGDCWRLFNHSSTLYFDMGGQKTRIIGPANSFPASSYFEIKVGNFYVRNLTKNVGTSGTTLSSIYTPAHSMTLFHDVDHDSNSTGKVYYLRIFDNNSLVRNFVPAKRNSDGAIGMYDTVNDKFYGNSGSGSFVAGPVSSNYLTCSACPNNLVSPQGAIGVGSCGRKLHIDDQYVYLRSERKTTPSLNIDIDNDGVADFFGNMSTTETNLNSTSNHKFKIQNSGQLLYLYDDTISVTQ